jgi:hypothetical protein
MRKNIIKGAAALALIATAGIGIVGCTSDADKASENISTAAEQFEIQREVVVINGITGKTILYAEGRCSFEDLGSRRFDLTCKVAANEYTRNTVFIGDQDSVTITQAAPIDVSVYHTRIILKPENILPEFDIEVGKQ